MADPVDQQKRIERLVETRQAYTDYHRGQARARRRYHFWKNQLVTLDKRRQQLQSLQTQLLQQQKQFIGIYEQIGSAHRSADIFTHFEAKVKEMKDGKSKKRTNDNEKPVSKFKEVNSKEALIKSSASSLNESSIKVQSKGTSKASVHCRQQDQFSKDSLENDSDSDLGNEDRLLCSEISISTQTRISQCVQTSIKNDHHSSIRSSSNSIHSSIIDTKLSANRSNLNCFRQSTNDDQSSQNLICPEIDDCIQQLLSDLAMTLCIKIRQQLNQHSIPLVEKKSIGTSPTPPPNYFSNPTNEFFANDETEDEDKTLTDNGHNSMTLKSNSPPSKDVNEMPIFKTVNEEILCSDVSIRKANQSNVVLMKSPYANQPKSSSSSTSYKQLPDFTQKEEELITKISQTLSTMATNRSSNDNQYQTIDDGCEMPEQSYDFNQQIVDPGWAQLDTISEVNESDLQVTPISKTEDSTPVPQLTDFSSTLDSLSSISSITSASSLQNNFVQGNQLAQSHSKLENKVHQCRYSLAKQSNQSINSHSKPNKQLLKSSINDLKKDNVFGLKVPTDQLWGEVLSGSASGSADQLRQRIRTQVQQAALLAQSTSSSQSSQSKLKRY